MTAKSSSTEKKSHAKSHKKSSSHNAHPNGVFLKNLITKRIIPKKLLDNASASIAIGALVMGLAGATVFLILSKKRNNKTLNKKILNTYYGIRDDASDMAHNALERGKKVYDTASDYAENIRDTAYDVVENHTGPLLLAGTVGGTILGVSIAYLLTKDKKADRNFLSRAMDAIDSFKGAAVSATENVRSSNWGSIASDVIETLSDRLHDDESEEEEESSGHSNIVNNLQHAIDMGITGFRLWQKLNNKKR